MSLIVGSGLFSEWVCSVFFFWWGVFIILLSMFFLFLFLLFVGWAS